MRRFTRLYEELDQTTRTSDKVAALADYFREAPPTDAVWALWFLTGRRTQRAVSHPRLREWAAAEAGLPQWLLDECLDAVGDLSETLALLLPDATNAANLALHELVEKRLIPLARLTDGAKREMLVETWRMLDARPRFVFHKLISGTFRVGVARKLVVRALAEVAGVDPAIMDHRLLGRWQPTAEQFQQLLSADGQDSDPARPYPFFLASPLEAAPAQLGSSREWLVEWKWDGIRAQIIRREGATLLWSRGEELISGEYPELREAATALPMGTVIDGEVLAWERDQPLPFALLQRRIGRKRVEPSLWPEVPIALMAYDLLEADGRDIRQQPLHARRKLLAELIGGLRQPTPMRLSDALPNDSWTTVEQFQRTAREHMAEGVMLKRLDSPYGVGRQRGDWWKWKVDPLRIDAVLIQAQPGSGKRASLFTDYTFGLWQGGELVPVAKAYSGLTDEEIHAVDSFVRRNTLERFGPIRVVKPELVFELAFEGIQASKRHKAGIAVRFPRMARWRHDKKPQDADTLATLRAMLDDEIGRAARAPGS